MDTIITESKSTSLPNNFQSQHTGMGITVVLNPLIVSLTGMVKRVCLVNAAGVNSYGTYSSGGEGSNQVYKWVQSYSKLRKLGFIVNDTFILKFDNNW